jgi:hypothetical protein
MASSAVLPQVEQERHDEPVSLEVGSMDGDDEIMDYLQSLLDHELDCDLDACPVCGRLRGVCNVVRQRIFEGSLQQREERALTAR